MYIKPTSSAAIDLFDVSEDALIYPKSEDIPCPWDASISIDGGNIIIEGSISSGATGNSCICECRLEDFTKYYRVEVPNNTDITNTGWEKE